MTVLATAYKHDSNEALDILRTFARTLTLIPGIRLFWGQSRTDGKDIWVHKAPWFYAEHKLSNAVAFQCKRATTAHEAFHILYSDFTAYEAFLTDPALTRRFHIEVLRAFGNGAEDGRIELAGVNEFPGTLPWIQLHNTLAVTAMQVPTEPVAALLQGFVAQMVAGIYPTNYEVKWPDWVKVLDGMAPMMEKARRARTTLECLAVVRTMLKVVEPFIPPMKVPAADPGRGESDMSKGLKGNPTSGEPGTVDPHLKPKAKPAKSEGEKGKGEPESKDGSAAKPHKSKEADRTDESAGSKKPADKKDGKAEGAKSRAEKGAKGDEGKGEEANSGSSAETDKPGEEEAKGAGCSTGTESEESGDAEIGADGGSADGDPEGGEDAWEASGESGASGEGDSKGEGDSEGGPATEGEGESYKGSAEPSDHERDTETWGSSGATDPGEDAEIDVEGILHRLKEAAEAEAVEALKVPDPVFDEIDDIDYRELNRGLAVGCNEGISFRLQDARPQPALYQQVLAEMGDLRDDLYREMKALIVKAKSDLLTGRRSGSLHASSLWRVSALGDTNVFAKRITPSDPAVAVNFLVDSSGSMGSHMQFGTQTIRKIDAVRYVLTAFTDVLEQLNVAHAATSFTDYGGDVVLKRLLKFGQHSGRESVVDFDACSDNRDGYCLRVATAELAARPEPVTILFVLSDGLPASTGYHGGIGVIDTAEARQEAQQKGVEVVSFYFGPDHPTSLKQETMMYGSENLVMVRDLADLATDMAGVLRQIVNRYRLS